MRRGESPPSLRLARRRGGCVKSALLTRTAAARQAGGKVAVLEKETFPRDKYCGAPAAMQLRCNAGG